MKQNKIAIALLAYGDEHINECLNLLFSLNTKLNYNFEYYVATDKPQKFNLYKVNCIFIDEEFNYNLKNVPINESLKYHDIVIFMDVDTEVIGNVEFEKLFNIEDGLHATTDDNFKNKETTYYSVLKNHTNGHEPICVFEHFFILKIQNQQSKINFIDIWNKLNEETKPFQIESKGCIGAEEGLIIGTSCLLNNIKILNPLNKETFDFFLPFKHFNN